jgi:hypothetical protein
MHDAGKITVGLVIFLAIVTVPVWYQAARGAEPGAPELEMPADAEECVEPGRYMRALHMDLLNVWRDEAVREGERSYVGAGGKVYEKSLTGTCMGCHSSQEAFCDRCHEYVGAEPYCWECHSAAVEMH